jgi:hypothetical protein
VTSVLAVGEQQAWVLGANTLACTDDAGAKWRQLTVDGERNPVNEYLRRDGEGVALLAPDKLHTTRDNGTSWQLTPMASVRLRDLHDGVLLGVWSGLPGVGDRNATTPFARLGDDRSPLRLVASGNALRVLSRAQAAERGPEMTIHESDDRGLNWSNFRVSLTAKVDIAGPAFGLGVDVIGGVHVQTEG